MILRSTHSKIGVKREEGALSSQANLALVRATWMRHDTELINSIRQNCLPLLCPAPPDRRLSQGLPTAFQMFDDRFFLFTEAGASELDVVAKSSSKIPSGTWALTNSGEFVGQPCSAFLAARRNGTWIIQATLPKRSSGLNGVSSRMQSFL